MALTCKVIKVEGEIYKYLYALLGSELLVTSWEKDLHVIHDSLIKAST